MIKNRNFIFFVVLTGCRLLVSAQDDSLAPLGFNAIVNKAFQKSVENNNSKLLSVSAQELPFQDDFSYYGPFPDTTLWENSESVFVNHTFGKNPITLGVATFDGLRKTGYPYIPLATGGSNPADTLTSIALRLDSIPSAFYKLSPADSIYLSFFYQPKGFADDPPEVGDEFIVDFYNPSTNAWLVKKTINRISASYKDSTFTRVMMAITDTAYFKNGFKFRFRNKNTGSGSVDVWHIDNVFLGINRFMNDTVTRDVSFVYQPFTLLNTNYTSMPYNHYRGSVDMRSSTWLTLRNNDNAPVNITGYMRITDHSGTEVYIDTTGTNNIQTFFPNGYMNDPAITTPSFTPFAYNSGSALTDSMTYTVYHYIKTSAFDVNNVNDTIRYKQQFLNYFAYDDGTAEQAYYLNPAVGLGAELAVKYETYTSDNLRAVDIYFNPTVGIGQIVNATFGLKVWADNGGIPGTVLYSDINRVPIFYQYGHNYFVRYFLAAPLNLNAGNYFIGMKQEDAIAYNIGFDANTNNQSKIFYNTSGTWTNASYKGSLMIRPVFGDSLWASSGVAEQNSLPIRTEKLFLYPNPSSDILNIIYKDVDQSTLMKITDITGKEIYMGNYSAGSIDVSELEPGFYFVGLYQHGLLIAKEKFLIVR